MINEHFIDRIKKELKSLPGEDAHQEMLPEGRERSSNAIKKGINVRQSAVSLILFKKNKELHFLLIQRSEYKGVHSKQISFPGGKTEPEDRCDKETALRETKEEVGIDEKALSYLGKLTNVYIPVSNFEVHPHVFYMHHKQTFEKDTREVDEVIPVPLNSLLENKNLHIKNISTSNNQTIKNVPCFVFDDKVVWGATAIILNEFKTLLKRL